MLKRLSKPWLGSSARSSFDQGPLLFAAVMILLCALSALYVVQHPQSVPTYAEVVPAGL